MFFYPFVEPGFYTDTQNHFCVCDPKVEKLSMWRWLLGEGERKERKGCGGKVKTALHIWKYPYETHNYLHIMNIQLKKDNKIYIGLHLVQSMFLPIKLRVSFLFFDAVTLTMPHDGLSALYTSQWLLWVDHSFRNSMPYFSIQINLIYSLCSSLVYSLVPKVYTELLSLKWFWISKSSNFPYFFLMTRSSLWIYKTMKESCKWLYFLLLPPSTAQWTVSL